ncbi:MAG: hypothetical protein IKY70_05895 [Bacteroidales bacterium]|nr:hypothetical protein [Bacteroidales bacterium]
MNNNRKLLVFGSVAAVILTVIIILIFSNLFGGRSDKGTVAPIGREFSLSSAIPSDAVIVFDIKESDKFLPMVNDTSSFAYRLVDETHPLSKIQMKLSAHFQDKNLPLLFSLHYSSKNDVSVLGLTDIADLNKEGRRANELLPFLQGRKKRYNSTDISTFDDSLNVALCGNVLIMSTSSFLVESVIRHLDNGTSLMDNIDFANLYRKRGDGMAIYINHNQIGKFFSGVVSRECLKYSDFILRYASWSSLEMVLENGMLRMKGNLVNEREEKYQSTTLLTQKASKSDFAKILPAQTLFCASMVLSDIDKYLEKHQLFLEVHKKLGGYKYKQHLVGIEGEMKPLEYAGSLGVKELVAAYCKFGDRYEWLTFVKGEASFGIGNMVASVIDKKRTPDVEDYLYKGYLESVFGELFSHCNEESICNLGSGWRVIGPKDIVAEFAVGNANYTSLDYWTDQTPLKGFLGKEGLIKVVSNIKESPDTLLQVIKPYYRNLFKKSLVRNNFEMLFLNISAEGGEVRSDIAFCATKLAEIPQERPREESADNTIYIDSTIVVGRGPFEIRDHVKGEKQYVEQLPNNKIRLMSAAKRGIWAIPFETPICGIIDQVDFFKNGKLQMIFISGDKLYLLDRMARIVRGFPVKLEKRVILGPKIVDMGGDRDYSFFVLNEDNSITLYKLEREKKSLEGIGIKAPEFVKELPEIARVNGEDYIILRSVLRTRIYRMDGSEVEVKDKKRVISNESAILEEGGDDIRVSGKDGKDFIVNLKSGKTRRVQ